MHFLEILGAKSKQNSKNFNEIALINAIYGEMDVEICRNIRAISLKFLLFCCFDFDPKITAKYIYLVYTYSEVFKSTLVYI